MSNHYPPLLFCALRLLVLLLLLASSSCNIGPVSALSTAADPSSNFETMTPSSNAVAKGLSVRIVSYNVLSSHLASPDHFTSCKPQDLDFANRLPRVLSKLEAEMKACDDMQRPLVFCLQEVSHSFAGPLHAFFANNRYAMITGLYGKPFNNYMGVALAYPIDTYETIAAEQVRLSDYRNGGWPREPKVDSTGFAGKVLSVQKAIRKLAKGTLKRGVKAIAGPVRGVLRLPPPPEDPIDHWHMSENRHNILISVCLRERAGEDGGNATNGEGQTFCLSNYHMPCAFYAPMVMNIHADLAAKRCQDFSGRYPHILAGDFNLMPDSPHYQLLTTGELLRTDPTYPTEKYGMVWNPEARPMRSAYALSTFGEPDWTNYAKIRDDDPFIGCLDYIFLSEEWKVGAVREIPNRDEAPGPLPTEDEPSDHVMISADLFLTGAK